MASMAKCSAWFGSSSRAMRLSRSYVSAATGQLPKFHSASEAASYMMDKFADKVSIRKEDIDRNQLRKLALTLDRPIPPLEDPRSDIPRLATVPPGYHLVYFAPEDVEADLGLDGTDRTFNAMAPFTRRMWAGGKMVFHHEQPLQTDVAAEEHTRFLSATAKKNKAGEEMVLVEVEKTLYSGGKLSLVDQRSWIFRPALDAKPVAALTSNADDALAPSSFQESMVKGSGKYYPVWQLSWSPVGLFRFSALTFNAHKIHYNDDWARVEEGHRGLVVHGPLNLITLLDYWRSVHGRDNQGRLGRGPAEVTYRALSPVYAGQMYQIRTGNVVVTYMNRTFEVLVERDGVVIMKASIAEAIHSP